MRPNATYKALIVEDSEELRRMLVRTLAGEGFECTEASDGVVAENLMRARRFDVVCLDLVMPRLNGHKLACDILEKPQPPLVVIMTGKQDSRLTRDLLARGVADVFYKPFSTELLCAKIQALLERNTSSPAAPGARVAEPGDSIGKTVETLRNEFARMTSTFEKTIQQLEKQNADLRSDFISSVQVFIAMMERKGQGTTSHVGRIRHAVDWYADELKFSPVEKHEIEVAAALHEIGQFGMPDQIRMKRPWELNKEERELYEKYPIMGATLMSEVRGAERIAEIIESHAENYDGSGFPHHKSGEAIPLAARVLRLADGVDTYQMFSDGACSEEELQRYVHAKSGVVFDPTLAGLASRFIAMQSVQAKNEEFRVVRATELPIGAVLLENVHDVDGRFLARAGAEVTAGLAQRLARLLGSGEVRIR